MQQEQNSWFPYEDVCNDSSKKIRCGIVQFSFVSLQNNQSQKKHNTSSQLPPNSGGHLHLHFHPNYERIYGIPRRQLRFPKIVKIPKSIQDSQEVFRIPKRQLGFRRSCWNSQEVVRIPKKEWQFSILVARVQMYMFRIPKSIQDSQEVFKIPKKQLGFRKRY